MTTPDAWHTLSPTHPLRSLRHAAALTIDGAALALGLPPTPGSASTITTPEQRGPAIRLAVLLDRAPAYAPPGHRAELEIRVRWVPDVDPVDPVLAAFRDAPPDPRLIPPAERRATAAAKRARIPP